MRDPRENPRAGIDPGCMLFVGPGGLLRLFQGQRGLVPNPARRRALVAKPLRIPASRPLRCWGINNVASGRAPPCGAAVMPSLDARAWRDGSPKADVPLI